MISKPIKAALAASVMATAQAGPAAADNLGAALVGSIIGGVIVNEANKAKRTQPARSSSPAYSAARVQNRETQTALNYFGFPAGTPDGVMGSKSRSAMSQYQAFMGFPATGQLSPYERDFLVSSYSRAQIGGPQVIQAMQGPAGVRGLLHTWRDEAMGGAAPAPRAVSAGYGGLPMEVSEVVDEIAASAEPSAEQLLQRSGFIQLADLNGDGKHDYMIDTSVSGSSFWCGASHCSVMVFASTPQGYQRNDFMARGVTTADFTCRQGDCTIGADGGAGTMAASAQAAPAPQPQAQGQTVMASAGGQGAGLSGIQLFTQPAAAAPSPSLASHCSKVSLLTSSNGGYVTEATMADPELALGEQFCLARSYAISAGEQSAAQVQGVSAAQIDSQCDAFGPAVRPFIAKLPGTGPEAVVAEVQKFVLQSNMSLEQLSHTAGICLFSGYRRDNMEVALGSALILTATGKRSYAELIGHHLAQGFGTAKSAQQARGWYMLSLEALEGGSEPAFAPGQPERAGLIKAAANALSQPAVQPVPAAASAAALPSFGTN